MGSRIVSFDGMVDITPTTFLIILYDQKALRQYIIYVWYINFKPHINC